MLSNMLSSLFKINIKDVIKSGIVALGGMSLFIIEELIKYVIGLLANSQYDFDQLTWKNLLGVAVVAAGGYIIKNFFSDTQGKFLGHI